MEKPLSLTVFYVNKTPYVSSIELFLKISPTSGDYYSIWLKTNITHQPQEIPIKGVDYIDFDGVSEISSNQEAKRPGPKRKQYLLSIPFAQQLCYQSKTLTSKQIREFLYRFNS